MRSQSFDEEATSRRQLPSVPKKPIRQSTLRDNREPTPDYDSGGGDKQPLATSPMKKSGPAPDLDQKPDSPTVGASENVNKNLENLNQTRGKIRL